MRRLAQAAALAVAAVAVGVGAAGGSAAASPHLKSGQRVVFRTGVLSVGSTVACTSHAIRIAARVPRRGHSVAKVAEGAKGGATLNLTTRSDGSVVARCR